MRSGRLWRVAVVMAGVAVGLAGRSSHSGLGAAAENQYQLVKDWPQWPAGYKFEYVSGVAVDAKGVVYAFMRDTDEKAGKGGTGSVQMFDRSGKYLGKWGKPGQADFITPHSLYFDAEGNLWTVDRDGEQVKKFRADGTLLMTVGQLRGWGTGPDKFNGPTGVQVFADGSFVVSDGYWNSRLVWFTKDGKFVRQVGKWGTAKDRGPLEFGTVHSIALTADNRVLAVDQCLGTAHTDAVVPGQIPEIRKAVDKACEDRIQVLDRQGKYLTSWTTVKYPLSAIVVGDRAYIGQLFTGPKDGSIYILDTATGKEVGRIVGASPTHSHQVGVDKQSGDVFVASVYPEHGGFKRGAEGPTLRRWARQPMSSGH
jgi:DNA-binding beta-propeller fold protein YncE